MIPQRRCKPFTEGKPTRAEGRGAERVLLARKCRGDCGHCAERERPGTEENRGFQTFADALQGSNRLLDGTSAKVRCLMSMKMNTKTKTNAKDSMSVVRRILGLAMIL